jgi:hypothetical protein
LLQLALNLGNEPLPAMIYFVLGVEECAAFRIALRF